MILKTPKPYVSGAICAVIWFCITGPTVFAQNIRVKIVSGQTVAGEIITLGSIAEISGTEESADRLRSVSLGYAPNIGMVRTLFRDRIALAIAAAGFTSADFSFDCPASVDVRRTGQEIGSEVFSEAVRTAVAVHLADENTEIRFVKIGVPEKLTAPFGTLLVTASLAGIRNIFAPFSMPVEIRIDDRIYKRFQVNVEIEAFAEVFVASHDLLKDQPLNIADVRLEKIKLDQSLASYLRELGNLRGLTLTKNLSAGTAITAETYFSSVVIRSGDLVRIEGQSGQMRIIVNGEARGSGKIGDRIAVKNLQSNAIIQAVVVDTGLVRVFF